MPPFRLVAFLAAAAAVVAVAASAAAAAAVVVVDWGAILASWELSGGTVDRLKKKTKEGISVHLPKAFVSPT